jgi:GR25 family glycosyltransferase involved in LPS biosynthesis
MDGFYINLLHRLDRKQHVETTLLAHPFFKNIERMDAVLNERGDIGCTMSHVKCLTELLTRNKEAYLIIEDDFVILDQDKFDSFANEFEKIKDRDDWDVLTLTPRGDTKLVNYIDNFHRIENNQTTTGYIVKHRFVETLLDYFKRGLVKLMNNEKPGLYALDQCWKPLQKKSNFVYYKHVFAGQLPGYSDIEQKNVNYNSRFLNQPRF